MTTPGPNNWTFGIGRDKRSSSNTFMNNPRPDRLMTQSAALTAGTGVAAVLGYAYYSAAARLLGVEEFAVLSALVGSAAIFASLVGGPIETSVCKHAAAMHGVHDRQGLASLLRGSLWGLVRFLAYGALPWFLACWLLKHWLQLDRYIDFLWLSVFAGVSLLGWGLRGILRGDHRFASFGLLQVVESFVRLAVGVGAVWAGALADGALAGYAVGSAAAMLFAAWLLRDLRGGPAAPAEAVRPWALTGPLFLLYLYFTLLSVGAADMLAATRFLDRKEAGLYAAATVPTRVLTAAVTPILLVLFSRVSALHAQRRRAAAVVPFALVLGAVGVGGAAALWWAGEWVVRLFGGAQYAGAESMLWIMWLTGSLLIVENLWVFSLLGTDRLRGSAWFLVPLLLFALLLSVFHQSGEGIAWCGLAAAAAGLVVAVGITRPST